MTTQTLDREPGNPPDLEAPTEQAANSAPRADKTRPLRVEFVDALKLLALLQMVNGHTLDAVMEDSIRQGAIFDRYLYLRGLVSVAFMMSAGLAYHFTTYARWEAHRGSSSARWARYRRGLFLIALGYLLHFPFGAFSDDPDRVARSIAAFTRVDVLQCIGFSILALESITSLATSLTQARIITGLAAIALLALAPAADLVTVDASSQWWANWLSHSGGSLFPITPWAAYVLGCAAIAGLLIPPDRDRVRTEAHLRIAGAGLAALVIGTLVSRAFSFEGEVHHASRPGFVVEKLGYVLLVLAGFATLMRDQLSLPTWLKILAGETLLIYCFHIMALYWTLFSPGRLFGHTLPLHQAILVSLAMIALSIAVALIAPRARAALAIARSQLRR